MPAPSASTSNSSPARFFDFTVVNVLESQLEAVRDDELLAVRQHELTAA